ncbi:MAG: hypothetical protein PGN23_08180 [Sphingomonas adhaesiva]|uniref:hypothetical protein n=1 Tax=Sphingomonas adhaesiva TaxID=28212 RepID=UPI002FF653DB
MTPYSIIPCVRPGSIMRTSATWSGRTQVSTWSTPAPIENSTSSAGSCAISSAVGAQAAR